MWSSSTGSDHCSLAMGGARQGPEKTERPREVVASGSQAEAPVKEKSRVEGCRLALTTHRLGLTTCRTLDPRPLTLRPIPCMVGPVVPGCFQLR